MARDATRDADALLAIVRDLAGLAEDVDRVLARVAAGARSLLDADGACVVTLDADGSGAHVAAGAGSLASLRGQRTELLAPPSPLHQAVVDRRVVVSALAGGRHVVVAPLVVDDATPAALCVVTDARGGFSARDAELAERLAEHGALAMRGAARAAARERDHERDHAAERRRADAAVEVARVALDALRVEEAQRNRRAGEEQRITEQLRQAEKMAALGELVAGVAHEINNPLTGVSAFAELLLDEPLTDDQRESVRLIKREAERAVGVVRDLLAFSRETEPSCEALDLNALVERTLRLRMYALRTAGIDVHLSLDPALPVVHGDAAKLQQVLLNLVLNAEHAMRESPARRLDVATRVGGATLAGDGRVTLSVSDTGVGIAPNVLPRVFEPFFTTKPAGEGTGLGLSVSYGIVQAHGGELRVESALGTGTTLAATLPASSMTFGTAPVMAGASA